MLRIDVVPWNFGISRALAVLLLWTAYCHDFARAQEAGGRRSDVPLAVARGTVRGEVYDAATRKPIRSAEIHLVPVPAQATEEIALPAGEAGERSGAVTQPSSPEQGVESVLGSSDMGGEVLMRGVPAGDYLVTAFKAGYVSPVPTFADLMGASEEQLRDMVKALPMVHVAGEQEATIRLGLHRGAVVFGRCATRMAARQWVSRFPVNRR